MQIFWTVLFYTVLAAILLLAVFAIIHGRKGMITSKRMETESKKLKVGYWLTSAIHMWVGILITACYGIALVLILVNM